ncbi:MAG TPA: magnesium/cobalt transporter CorA [Anaerolineales bacterium]|nr:magnesium/cobalt transporter CorA [Anaerolineales bacterium]
MIRLLHRDRTGRIRRDLNPADLTRLLRRPGGTVWIDFAGEAPEVCEPILRQAFGFHPLAIDDALQESHIPKLDDWGDYLYLAIHAIHYDPAGETPLTTHEFDAFLGPNYLVTHHDDELPEVDRIWQRIGLDQRYLADGPDHLYYTLADEIIYSYLHNIEGIDGSIEEFEDEVFERPTPATLERVFALKRGLLQLRRVVGPQREVFNKLARDDLRMIDKRDRVYFRDVYDHLVRLHDINESMRDQVTGVLEIYLSVINNRMNEIMKTLTLITTIFMPISFLVGFFGMNYFAAPLQFAAWTSLPSFGITMLVLALTPVGFVLWFRRRKWL